jgi:hypothetical protein
MALAVQQYKNYLKFVDLTINTIEIEGARSIDDPVEDEVLLFSRFSYLVCESCFFRALVMFLRVCVFLSVSSL